jgi:hypothetical protein
MKNISYLYVTVETFFESSLTRERVLASRWLAMDYSGFSLLREHVLPNRYLAMVMFVTIYSTVRFIIPNM